MKNVIYFRFPGEVEDEGPSSFIKHPQRSPQAQVETRDAGTEAISLPRRRSSVVAEYAEEEEDALSRPTSILRAVDDKEHVGMPPATTADANASGASSSLKPSTVRLVIGEISFYCYHSPCPSQFVLAELDRSPSSGITSAAAEY